VNLLEASLRPGDYYVVDGHWRPSGHDKAAAFLFNQLFVAASATGDRPRGF